MAEVITVSALNQYVKTLLDANDILFDLALRGEIANFVQNARSGHCYFSLRDASASVKAVMFRSDARRLGFRPEEGMKVVVRCRATLYERVKCFQIKLCSKYLYFSLLRSSNHKTTRRILCHFKISLSHQFNLTFISRKL